MRLIHLLALCSTALASPCKPSASSATSAVATTTEKPSLPTTQPVTISESAAASTTSAEPSTTISDAPQQPSNLIRNAGFEDDTIAPWTISRDFGTPTLSTAEFHGGSQSGFISASLGGPGDIGFRNVLDASLFEADKPANFGESLNEWVLASVTCSWSQTRLDAGISVAVRGTCQQLSFYVDDASLVAVE
ncbi:hypothetical protein HYE67_003145 [Fusarium culmorum]|uniref:Uncharacterized protein n=1 Tax=Fusarium culmorum TaxID=5516 RepID=A0A2T4GMZ1_FUSCU|nr:hypothetical protein FCULG_00000258 [Fusarium culmorum]QPC60914.1 hypothetical protein HYE67_003145 [Fusarium culmorum]